MLDKSAFGPVNKSDIAVNKSDIVVNKSDIAANKLDIAVNTGILGGWGILVYTWLCSVANKCK